VTLGLCNITAKLPSENLRSWPPENRSVAPSGGRGPRLRDPGLGFHIFVSFMQLISYVVANRFHLPICFGCGKDV